MILFHHLLQAALAVLLAYLAGTFVRGERTLAARGAAPRHRDRLLGFALHLASAFIGSFAVSHLAGAGGHAAVVPLSVAAPLLVTCWLGAVGLGLRRTTTAVGMRWTTIAAVVTIVLILVSANGEFSRADVFLLVALLVWLGCTLLLPNRSTK